MFLTIYWTRFETLYTSPMMRLRIWKGPILLLTVCSRSRYPCLSPTSLYCGPRYCLRKEVACRGSVGLLTTIYSQLYLILVLISNFWGSIVHLFQIQQGASSKQQTHQRNSYRLRWSPIGVLCSASPHIWIFQVSRVLYQLRPLNHLLHFLLHLVKSISFRALVP